LEGGICGQQDVSNNTDGPDVALSRVVFLEDFWGNIVRRPNLFKELGVLLSELSGSSPVNDFDLVVSLCILQKNVFRLDVSVSNAHFMAVIETGQNLLEDDSCVPLVEFTPLLHLFEELSALGETLNNVEAFFIFEVLEHLHDVGMVLPQLVEMVTYKVLHNLKLVS